MLTLDGLERFLPSLDGLNVGQTHEKLEKMKNDSEITAWGFAQSGSSVGVMIKILEGTVSYFPNNVSIPDPDESKVLVPKV